MIIVYIYIYIYIYNLYVSWPIVVKDDSKASFFKVIALRFKGKRYFSVWITPPTLDSYLIVMSQTFFWVFGITRPRIKPQSSGPLTNILHTMPKGRFMQTESTIWLYTRGTYASKYSPQPRNDYKFFRYF